MARTTDKKKEGMGARVEAARKQKGWSQEQLADWKKQIPCVSSSALLWITW